MLPDRLKPKGDNAKSNPNQAFTRSGGDSGASPPSSKYKGHMNQPWTQEKTYGCESALYGKK